MMAMQIRRCVPMLYLSKATLTFRAFEWVEAFEKVALLYLKLLLLGR